MLKFLPGILIVQFATAAMLYAASKTAEPQLWLAIGLLALLTGVVTGFWFAAIARHDTTNAVARAQNDFSKEREQIKLSAERHKSKIIKESHKQLLQETRKTEARAGFKVGAAFVGVIAAGSLMLFTQMLTLGLLTLSTGGGALLGYLARGRQLNLLKQKNATQAYLENRTADRESAVK